MFLLIFKNNGLTSKRRKIILRYDMSHTVKTAITLPREEFRWIEDLCRKTKKSRSRVILEAVRSLFHQRTLGEAEERYARGYEKRPEEEKDVEVFYRAGLSSWENEEW